MRNQRPIRFAYYFLLLIILIGSSENSRVLFVFAPYELPEVEFAVQAVDEALTSKGLTFKKSEDEGAMITICMTEPDKLRSEGYEIIEKSRTFKIQKLRFV